MIDILGLVYDFVRDNAWRNNDVPQLKEDQIIRGWQNTGTLPERSTEFCVITLLQSIRHGAPVNLKLVTGDDYNAQIFVVNEHVIQIDFCSAEPFVLPQATKLRADTIAMLSFTPLASEYFLRRAPTVKVLYADDVQDLSYLDPDKLYTARYSTRLHLTEQIHSSFIVQDSFNSVNLHVENVNEHHKIH